VTGLDYAAVVDPDLRPALAVIPDLGDLSNETVSEVRNLLAGLPPSVGLDNGVEVTWVSIPVENGPTLPALLYMPVGAPLPLPALLNIHGGGFVVGSAARDDDMVRTLARGLGCAILSPDYRLAPEYPYPAALDDCHAALAWLAALPQVDPARIGIRGISAGGGLALGLALRVRDERATTLCCLHLVYPMLDDRTAEHPFNGRFVWTASANRFGWQAMLGDHDRDHPAPYAVPGRAHDLADLPSTFVAVGSIDLFADEALALASRLMAAGVPVELHLYPGAFHGFILVAASRVAKAFERDSLAALTRAFND